MTGRLHSFMQRWSWPIGLAVLTMFGLLSALLSAGGVWRWLSWLTLATPLLAIIHHVRGSRRDGGGGRRHI